MLAVHGDATYNVWKICVKVFETFSVKMFNAHISSSNANLEVRDGTLKKWQQKIKISRRSRQPTSSESLASENPIQASEVKSHPGAVQ